jgi:hypothetical protein
MKSDNGSEKNNSTSDDPVRPAGRRGRESTATQLEAARYIAVQKVTDRAAGIILPSGGNGRIPIGEVFIGNAESVVMQGIVYHPPGGISVGQKTSVLAIDSHPQICAGLNAVREA